MAKLVTKETTDTQTLDTDSQDHGKDQGQAGRAEEIPKHLKQEQEKKGGKEEKGEEQESRDKKRIVAIGECMIMGCENSRDPTLRTN